MSCSKKRNKNKKYIHREQQRVYSGLVEKDRI